MALKKKNNISLNDQYVLGTWTEYKNTFCDDDFNGKNIKFTSFANTSSTTGSLTFSVDLSPIPNNTKLKIASKVAGFLNGENATIIENFEQNEHPFRVFRLYEYVELTKNYRYSNPQRIIKGYNSISQKNDGSILGTPLILDSLVPQPPDYILALNKKLTSQWSYDKIKFSYYNDNGTPTASYAGFAKQPFRFYSPFTYNFTDDFVNKMWTKIKISESLPIKSTFKDELSELASWYEEEKQDELSYGNHLGLTLLPYTNSITLYTTFNWEKANYNLNNIYSYNSFTKGPVHIGLGRVNIMTGINVVSSYATKTTNSTTHELDIIKNNSIDYYNNLGSTRSFLFESQGLQPNLCEQWLYDYPNEYKFKNLSKQNRPKRLGNNTWAASDNANYSVQGWQIPSQLQDIEKKDNISYINDQKIGTLFWRFDYGSIINKYLGATFPYIETLFGSLQNQLNLIDSSNFRYQGVTPVSSTMPGTLLSPTIIMADHFGAPKGYFYQGIYTDSANIGGTTYEKVIPSNFQSYPKLRDMANINNEHMQFSLSFNYSYPKINDIYKSFYGFGEGITTVPSEYQLSTYPMTSTFGTASHRKRVTWGRDKIPSFKFQYQYLHTMIYHVNPIPIEEEPVRFKSLSLTESFAVEPEQVNTTTTTPSLGNWWEGPCIVAGPILRGYKYGLYDAVPKVPASVYRRDRFGQFRDMLEQRQFFATKYSETDSETYVVSTTFVTGSNDEAIWKNYNNWNLGDPAPLNFMDAGLYELHNRVGKPFNESGWMV